MPPSVITATTALGIVLLGQVSAIGLGIASGEFPQSAGDIPRAIGWCGVGALVLVGFVLGNRLAWQWGRYLSILAAVLLFFLTVSSPVAFKDTRLSMLVLRIVFWVSFVVMFLALSRTSAMQYFRLECSQCKKVTKRAANFLFTKAKCRSCDVVW